MSTVDSPRSGRTVLSALRRFLGAPFRLGTYGNLLYLALAFPLGITYFVGFVTGVSLGMGLLITLVGLPILVATLAGTVLVASLEAWLARHLVGVDVAVPAVRREFDLRGDVALPGDGFLAAVTELLLRSSTWTSVVLVLTKFGFGIVSFVALVTLGSVVAVLLAAPLVYDDTTTTLGVATGAAQSEYSIGAWVVDTLPEALAVAVLGVVLAFVAVTLLNALAHLQARFTAKLLAVGE